MYHYIPWLPRLSKIILREVIIGNHMCSILSTPIEQKPRRLISMSDSIESIYHSAHTMWTHSLSHGFISYIMVLVPWRIPLLSSSTQLTCFWVLVFNSLRCRMIPSIPHYIFLFSKPFLEFLSIETSIGSPKLIHSPPLPILMLYSFINTNNTKRENNLFTYLLTSTYKPMHQCPHLFLLWHSTWPILLLIT